MKPFERKPTPPPSKPKTLFGEKKEWSRLELRRKLTKESPYIPGAGGKMYPLRERKEMIEKVLPYQRFKSHISEIEAKKRLRELRKEEYQAPTQAKKVELNRLRRYLEERTDLKGKY